MFRPLILAPTLGFLALSVLACSGEDDGGRTARDGSSTGTGSSPGLPSDGSGGGLSLPTEEPQEEDKCGSVLKVVYRDFSEAHTDFEWSLHDAGWKGDVVRMKLVEPELGGDKKPVFRSVRGCGAPNAKPEGGLRDCAWENDSDRAVITSKETFDQWYRTVEDVNHAIERDLELLETPEGSGKYVFDSSDFFPLTTDEGFGVTPAGNAKNQNFLFTTEIHLEFGYQAGQRFTFRGDDDLWIFINGKLAMDLGGLHGPEEGVIDFDLQAADLGIVPGGVYSMDIFHAERQTDGSNFRVETNISCFKSVVVR